MKTMAPHAPTNHTSARCKASTPDAAVIDGSDPPAVAAYAITHSRNATKQCSRYLRHCEERSDEAIHLSQCGAMDCFAPLAMTNGASLTQYAFSLLVISASGVLSRM